MIPYFTFHKSLGLTIFALAVLRLAWKLFDTRPDEPSTMPRWHVTGAKLGHALLYILLFLVPLSGWWYDSVAALRPLYFWGLFEVPHLGGPDPTIPDLKEHRRRRGTNSVLGARRRRRRTCARSRCIISSLRKTACSRACGRRRCNAAARPHRPYRPNRRYRSSPMNRRLPILLSLCTLLPMTASARDWQVDYAKSSLTFKDTVPERSVRRKIQEVRRRRSSSTTPTSRRTAST